MTERSFVDTNVLVYRFDHGEPAKRAVAKRLLDRAFPGSLVISTQVLAEFYVVITRKLSRPLRPDLASEAVERLSALPVVGSCLRFQCERDRYGRNRARLRAPDIRNPDRGE